MAKKRNTKRADGRIAVQVYLGRDENNKRLYKTVYGKTQKEADEKALQVKVAMKKGLDVTAERDTFGQWAERWLKIKAAEVSSGQHASYKAAIDSLNARFGDMPLKDIRSAELQEYLVAVSYTHLDVYKRQVRHEPLHAGRAERRAVRLQL